jgi:hypothetical protein
MKIRIRRTDYQEHSLSPEEAFTALDTLLREGILGKGNSITNNGDLVYWTSWPHGSGTTTVYGPATELERAAWHLLHLLHQEPKEELRPRSFAGKACEIE